MKSIEFIADICLRSRVPMLRAGYSFLLARCEAALSINITEGGCPFYIDDEKWPPLYALRRALKSGRLSKNVKQVSIATHDHTAGRYTALLISKACPNVQVTSFQPDPAFTCVVQKPRKGMPYFSSCNCVIVGPCQVLAAPVKRP